MNHFTAIRQEAAKKVEKTQQKRKDILDKKRKPPKHNKVNDLVVVVKNVIKEPGTSRKLMFSRHFIVKAVRSVSCSGHVRVTINP